MAIEPITAALEIGGKLIDRLWPDKEKADAAKLELYRLNQSGELAQIVGQLKINEIEAANPKVFVSGWRPFIGWVCGVACAWNWIGLSVLKAVLSIMSVPATLEPASLTEMLPVLLGLLGLGTLRTMEKINQVAAR